MYIYIYEHLILKESLCILTILQRNVPISDHPGNCFKDTISLKYFLNRIRQK